MIVWGSRIQETDRGTGSFFCPVCRDDRHYVHQQVSRYFTLNFVSLFQTDRLAEYVRCAACCSEFRPVVLTRSPEQILLHMPLWNCCACGCRNIGDESPCVACGEVPVLG
jgi:hypothetical protein